MTIFYVTIPLASHDTVRKPTENGYLNISEVDKALREREGWEICNLKDVTVTEKVVCKIKLLLPQ